VLTLEPWALLRMPLLPRSCISVEKALWAVVRLPDWRALLSDVRSFVMLVLVVLVLVVLAVCELPP